MAEGKDEAAFRIMIKNQVRRLCVAKIVRGKLTKPLPTFAVGEAVEEPIWAQTCRDGKLRPNHTFTEVVKAGRVRDAEFGVFAQACGQPGGAGFERTYPNKIKLDRILVQLARW